MATKLSDLLSTTYVGTAGPAGTIQVGTVTSDPGNLTITNVGTEKAAILNFNIPSDSQLDEISASNGDVLVYNGSEWVAGQRATTGKAIAMAIVFGG
jgi:hypothetical protein